MKLMFIKHLKFFLFVASGLIFITSSCSKLESSVEDSEQDSPQWIADGNISESFNWSTSKSVAVKVKVDDQYNGQYFYKLELFDREPHLEGAISLAAGLAKEGQEFEAIVTIPTTLSQVFVKKTTPRGEVSYSILEVDNSSFIARAKRASLSKVAAVNNGSLTRLATTNFGETRPSEPVAPTAGVIYVSGSTNYTNPAAGQVYVIKKGERFSGSLPLNSGVSGVKVYVLGSWHHGGSVDVGADNKVVVASNSGALDVASVNLLSGTASLENYGDLLLSSLSINSSNSFVNVGTLVIKDAVSMVGAAQFVNYQKDVKVKVGSMTFNHPDAVTTNNGEIEILVGNFTNGTLNANCYTTVGKMTSTNATVNIRSLAKLDVTNLEAKGGVYNIYPASELDVTKTAHFSTDNNKKNVEINSLGTNGSTKSFARMKEVSVGEEAVLHLAYSGYLQVVTDSHPNRSSNKFITDGSMNVEILWDLYNHPPYVPSTSCNNGGVGSEPINPPVDQKPVRHKIGVQTYLFEDNWPEVGDYDLNDCVFGVEAFVEKNNANKIERIILINRLYALGATRGMAVGVQLDNIAAEQVKSVTYSNINSLGNFFKLDARGLESGQQKAVVAVTDDAHKEFGLTTRTFVYADANPVETVITIDLVSPIESFTIGDLNPFISSFRGSITAGKRYEVHMVGRLGTDKLDPKVVENAVAANKLASASEPFKAKDNKWPFAISVPVLPFKYQRTESKNIGELYPKFYEWVNTSGASNQDWYLFPKN